MKLRIQDNSIRFRLSQSDVRQLVLDGAVTSSCKFSNVVLNYTIVQDEQTHAINALLLEREIRVSLPSTLVKNWHEDERVGFDASDESGLYILIEKDFQCLQPRPNEDESDLFVHPNSSHKHCGNE